VAGPDVRAVHRVDERFARAGAAIQVQRRLHGVGEERAGRRRGAWTRALEVEEAVGSEVGLALLHLRLVGLEEFGEEPALLAEHVAREVDRLAVDAQLGVVGRELLAVDVGLHVELEHVPLAAWVAGLADSDEVDRLVRAVERDAERLRAFDLEHRRPEATVRGVIERPRVAHEGLALVGGIAWGAVGVRHVGHTEEVLGADRPSRLDLALGVENLELHVHALEDELRRRCQRHVGRVASGGEVRTRDVRSLLTDEARRRARRCGVGRRGTGATAADAACVADDARRSVALGPLGGERALTGRRRRAAVTAACWRHDVVGDDVCRRRCRGERHPARRQRLARCRRMSDADVECGQGRD